MNCIGNIESEYHSKQGIVEKIILLSVNDDDCIVSIVRDNKVIRVSNEDVRFLAKPHCLITDTATLTNKDDVILTNDEFCIHVTIERVFDDGSVDVRVGADILVDGEQTLHSHVECLSLCGDYVSFDGLRSTEMCLNSEFSRYLNNISIFQPLLSRVRNVLISWDSENSTIRVRALDELSVKKVELLMPVLVHQLAVLLGGVSMERMNVLARHIVWEYRYENEDEANFAIGIKGAHIVAVRNMPGIAGVVLTKSNRLRIIAENKHALKAARAMLEVRRQSHLVEDNVVPMLIGKSASNINALISKTGLHCVHLRNLPSNGVIRERPLIVDTAILGKRELLLFGSRKSIVSAKLLLEVEESVKDLRREFESQKLKKNASLKSSSSSVSKESESKCDDGTKTNEEETEKRSVEPLSWADTPVGDSEDEPTVDDVTVTRGDADWEGGRRASGGRDGPQSKLDHRQPHSQKGPRKAAPEFTGGLVFTNSALSAESGQRQTGSNRNRPARQNNRAQNNYYRPRNRQAPEEGAPGPLDES